MARKPSQIIKLQVSYSALFNTGSGHNTIAPYQKALSIGLDVGQTKNKNTKYIFNLQELS